jgi:hypothetical protein
MGNEEKKQQNLERLLKVVFREIFIIMLESSNFRFFDDFLMRHLIRGRSQFSE